MVGAWEHLPAARIPAPPAPHVVAMDGHSAEGLAPGVHRGLPSAGLTLVLSLDRPLRTAPTEQAWSDGVRDAQWVSLGGLHTRAATVEQPGRWAGVQLGPFTQQPGTTAASVVEQDYGSREPRVTDPEGNQWSFGTYAGEPRRG